MQQQQLLQLQQRLAEAKQESAAAATELEQLRSKQLHLEAKAASVEADWRKQQVRPTLNDSTNVAYILVHSPKRTF